MSAVLGVVRGHKGAIFVQSQPRAGTRVQVLFPAGGDLVAPKKASPRGELPQSAPGRSHGVVLVADDEVQVRLLAERALTRAGFQVLSAGDGLEAVKLLNANADRVECAILDLTMPGLDGVKTFQEMRRANPQLKAILASGYDQQELRGRYDGLGFAAFVQKPFEITRLVEKVRQLVVEQVSAPSGSP